MVFREVVLAAQVHLTLRAMRLDEFTQWTESEPRGVLMCKRCKDEETNTKEIGKKNLEGCEETRDGVLGFKWEQFQEGSN